MIKYPTTRLQYGWFKIYSLLARVGGWATLSQLNTDLHLKYNRLMKLLIHWERTIVAFVTSLESPNFTPIKFEVFHLAPRALQCDRPTGKHSQERQLTPYLL